MAIPGRTVFESALGARLKLMEIASDKLKNGLQDSDFRAILKGNVDLV